MLTAGIVHPPSGEIDHVSRLGLGCSHVGSFGNLKSDREVREVLALAVDLGITLFDTADIYGQGDSEREIGRVAARHPGKLFVVTKAGNVFSAKMRALRPFKPVLKPLLRSRMAARSVTAQRSGNMAKDFSPRYLGAAVERSLRRLGVDRLDALLLHSPAAADLATPALADALADLVARGRARHIGVSVDDHAGLAAAAAMPGISLVEVTPAVLDAAGSSGVAAQLVSRGISVLAREVIRYRPGLAAPLAVRAAADRADIAVVIAGTTDAGHLRALAAAMPG